jgi:ABC-type Fe3+ transport system permease subunit
LAAVTSGVIWLAVAGLLLSAVRKTPPKQRKRSLFTALTGLLVCGVALGTGLFWLLLLG